MRRIIAVLGIVMLGAVGCHHRGGKCDCGPAPGEAALYAPMQGYPTVAPVGGGPVEPIGPPKEMPKKL
jgi:hypothetical protein